MLDFYLYTNIGNREVNEDSIGVEKCGDTLYFFLADGLGGHGKGDAASQLTVGKAKEYIRLHHAAPINFPSLFQFCQDALMQEQENERCCSQMKTTLTTIRIDNKSFQWAHIGDSRIYYFRRGRLLIRTLDHSVPQMLVNSREIKEKEIRNHEDRNKLLKVIGAEWNTNPCEVSRNYTRKSKEAFLLCSDGFWENINEEQMRKCLKKSKSAEEWLLMMRDIVMINGAEVNMDNNSAITILLKK